MGTLTNDLKKFAELSMQKAEKVAQASLLTAGGRVIKDTPVLDGFLINSWMSSWGAIDENVRDSSKSGAESTEDLSQTLTDIKLGTDFYFTNSQPYAYGIEYDNRSPINAPNGMLRVNLLDWDNIVMKNIKRYQ